MADEPKQKIRGANDGIKTDAKPSASSKTIAPLADEIRDETYWRKRILTGTIDERIKTIEEAVETRNVDVITSLIELIKTDEDVSDLCLGDCVEQIGLTGLAKDKRDELIDLLFCQVILNPDCKNFEDALTILDHLSEGHRYLGKNAQKHVEFLAENIEKIFTVEVLLNMSEDEKNKEYILKIAPRLLDALVKLIPSPEYSRENTCADYICNIMANINYKKGIPVIKDFLKVQIARLGTTALEDNPTTIQALKKLGISDKEINEIIDDMEQKNMETGQTKDEMTSSLPPHQKAAYDLLSKHRNIKRLVMEKSKVLQILPDQQTWLTINAPKLAKELLNKAKERLNTRIGGLDNAIHASVGVRTAQLCDEHFTYFTDEIIDAVIEVIKSSNLKDDSEISALIGQARYSNGTRLRYVKREMSDLSLGDKCGDCTAKGSINFGNAIMWLVNPAYNIIKMSKDGRFIGKMNFTLGNINTEEAIIIDALEFNPQTQKGKPYHEDAKECFAQALEFLKDLAKKEKRKLYGLATSNSDGAIEILNEKGEKIAKKRVEVKLLIPSEEIEKILKTVGYIGKVELFYQMLDVAGTIDISESNEGIDKIDEKLPELERMVANPAQIEIPEIAKTMNERNFIQTAKRILKEKKYADEVKRILGVPVQYDISPKLLAEKLELIYKTEAFNIREIQKAFNINGDNFVKLS